MMNKKELIHILCKQHSDKGLDVKMNIVYDIQNKVKKRIPLCLAAMIILTATACGNRAVNNSQENVKESKNVKGAPEVTDAETSWYPGKGMTYNGKLRWGCQNQEQMAYVESVMDATFYAGWYEDCKARLTDEDWKCLNEEKEEYVFSDAQYKFRLDCYIASHLTIKNDYSDGGYGDPEECVYSAYQELVGSTSNCGSRAQFGRAFFNRMGYETSFVDWPFVQHAWFCVYLSDGTVVDRDCRLLDAGVYNPTREPDVIVYDRTD